MVRRPNKPNGYTCMEGVGMANVLSNTLRYFRNVAITAATLSMAAASSAFAHGISEESRETMVDGGLLDFIWLGAEHMVTGYDHLLFLFGVLFFLSSFRDVVRFITAFTLGHCITLLGATLMGITANAYIIDAVIALSVIYKGFENLDGFKKVFGIEAPNLLSMVFIFGLIHGFGLSTRLQELTLRSDGLVSRILAFNVGVELGQIAALTVMLVFFKAWRSTPMFERFDRLANIALIGAGVGLFGMQVDGYLHEDDHHRLPPVEGVGHHVHGADAAHDHAPAEAPKGEGSLPVEKEDTGASPKVADEKAAPSDGEHSHGATKPHSHEKKHSHGSGKPHSHGKTHRHGSGKPHSH